MEERSDAAISTNHVGQASRLSTKKGLIYYDRNNVGARCIVLILIYQHLTNKRTTRSKNNHLKRRTGRIQRA